MKIGIMGEVKSSGKTVTSDEHTRIITELNERLDKLKKVNLVFVIDGTYSMDKYFSQISGVIKNYVKGLQRSGAVQYKFAVVVFRDKDEKPLFQLKERTDKADEVAAFLDGIKASAKPDKDDAEAVFYGIKKAITMAALCPPDETNYLILVGDAGNHNREDETRIQKNEIIDLLYQNKYNFLAFQVHMFDKPAYMDFHSQAKDIMIKVAVKCHQEQLAASRKSSVPVFPPPRVIADPTNRRFVISTPYLSGAVSYIPHKQQTLDPLKLKELIEQSIKSLHDTIQCYISMISEIERGKSINDAMNVVNGKIQKTTDLPDTISYIAPGFLFNFFTNNPGMPSNAWEVLSKNRFQMYINGYTPVSVSGMRYPLWQKDLFATDTELDDLIKRIEELNNAGTSKERRKQFKAAWLQILKNHVGNLSDKEIMATSASPGDQSLMEKSIGEIEQMVFGLPGTSDFLSLKLSDLDDKAMIDDIKLESWVKKITGKLAKLYEIKRNENKLWDEYSFVSNKVRYFYIPQALLP
jgi:hypothetical protein